MNFGISAKRPGRSLCVTVGYIGLTVLNVILAPHGTVAQTPDKVRQAFVDLKEDNIRYNCARATYWLYKHRDALRDQILTELYRTTDPQERDSLLLVLFETKTFQPNERFARLVAQRLREEDTRVPNLRFVLPSVDDDGNVPDDLLSIAHRTAWYYIDHHYELFEPILKSEIGQTNDMWQLWGIAWMMKLKGTLNDNAALFTPAAFRVAAENLKDDDKEYNASEAARFFLLLPDQGLPVLQEITQSSDPQENSLARELVDAITTGSRDAYGRINAQCDLTRGLMGVIAPEPEWVAEYTDKYTGFGGVDRLPTPNQEENELTSVYSDLLKKLPPIQRTELIKAERAWVAFKENNQQLLSEFRKSGLVLEGRYGSLLSDQVRTRKEQLRTLLAPRREPFPGYAQELAQSEKELNRQYQRCLDTLSPALQKKLREGQRLWIAFREGNRSLLPSAISSITYSRVFELWQFEHAARVPESKIPNPFERAK